METIKQLIIKRLSEPLDAMEEKILQDWMAQSDSNRAVVEEISDPVQLAAAFAKLDALKKDQAWERVKNFAERHQQQLMQHSDIKRRVRSMRWLRYAAALILLSGTGYYLWLQRVTKAPVTVAKRVVSQDVPAPASTLATITLADGSKILIDSTRTGLFATQGNTRITKSADGTIRYSDGNNSSGPQYNTFTVPRGSMIASIMLSDGTRVFLNAGSSLTYPVAFSKTERRTEITGEAYFEVFHDVRRPFIVAGRGMTTQVLGTEFNVNTYPDDSIEQVTLLQGRVKVIKGSSNLLISPGEQAAYSQGRINVNRSVDIEQVVAWKNGLFNFQDKKLPEVMRQIARWYDLQVIYEKEIPEIEFFGQMGRDLNLSDVLKVLESAGVKFRLEQGKRLFIM